MAIANGLSLPNPLSNGTTADAVQVMADYNYLLSAVNRALLDSGGGAGMNAQSTQIHNLANATAANDAVNLSQLGGYAVLTGGWTCTGNVTFSGTVTLGGEVLTGSTLWVNTNKLLLQHDGTTGFARTQTGEFWLGANGATSLKLDVAGNTNVLGGLSVVGAAALAALTASGLITGNAGFSGTTLVLSSTLNVTGQATLGATVLTAAGALTPAALANAPGYLGVPPNAKTANYTLALSDMGLGVDFNGASLTCTIPANASVAFPIGAAFLITNLNATSLNIAITTDTLIMAGGTSTGTRTLSQNGIASLRKVSATSWLISGVGLG